MKYDGVVNQTVEKSTDGAGAAGTGLDQCGSDGDPTAGAGEGCPRTPAPCGVAGQRCEGSLGSLGFQWP